MPDFTCVALKGYAYVPCGEPVFKWFSRVPLCQRHYSDALNEVGNALRRDQEQWEREHIVYGPREWDADAAEVVYYVRRLSDGLIKIGTSGGFRRRFSELQHKYGLMQILLTHRGDEETEKRMHRKFEGLWVMDEFFRPGMPLLAWIVKIRKRQMPGTELKGTIPMNDLLILSAILRSQCA